MKTNDYRNTEYCLSLEAVKEKKLNLEKNIMERHSRQKNMYNKVHDRESDFNKSFIKIYNCKCAYCGVSMRVLPSILFEVDHFIAESSFADKNEAGKVDNLVLSCYQCNRNKKDFLIDGEYIEKLSTDTGNIAEVFFRNEKYYICINSQYQHDVKIKEFYHKLQLDHQSRRLDYLLMNMKGLHNSLKGTPEGGKLAEAIMLLQERRNEFVKG